MNNELLTAGNLYGSLINDIGNILVEARGKICREINSVMVDAYWNIGKYIVEYEQKGEERAEYGSNLLNRLSKDLTRLYGKGFGKSNLLYIRKLYLYFPKEADRKVKYSVSFLFCILLPSFSFFLYAALSSLIFFKGVPIFCINT